jgi:hypothetical protein
MLSPLGCPENLQLEPSGIITRIVSSVFSILPTAILPVSISLPSRQTIFKYIIRYDFSARERQKTGNERTAHSRFPSRSYRCF